MPKFKLESINQWLALIGGIITVLGAGYALFQYLSEQPKAKVEDFVGVYEGEAEGSSFKLGIELVGKNQVIGEVDFGDPDYIEVQLTGEFNQEEERLDLQYRRNINHLRGSDKGKAYISFDKKASKYSGYWTSTEEAGNEEKWKKFRKISDSFEVTSWNGGLEK